MNFYKHPTTFTVQEYDLSTSNADIPFTTGFSEALPYPLPQTPHQSQMLNDVYLRLHLMERKRILAHAKFLKCFTKPTAASWLDLESKYEIYPASCFISHAAYKSRRRDWLRSLELDLWPFSYVNKTEKYNEIAEVEWNELSEAHRAGIENHARMMKESMLPYANAWCAVEDVFGFPSQTDMGGDDPAFKKIRISWLKAIGMGTSSPEAAQGILSVQWNSKSAEEKRTILDKARAEKERFCKERLAQEASTELSPRTGRVALHPQPAQTRTLHSSSAATSVKSGSGSNSVYRPSGTTHNTSIGTGKAPSSVSPVTQKPTTAATYRTPYGSVSTMGRVVVPTGGIKKKKTKSHGSHRRRYRFLFRALTS